MSTKCTIAYRYETADEPGFHLYEDCFDIDDGAGMPVYLQLDGIHTELETRRCGATVTVKLSREMAQVLGLIKSKDKTQEWQPIETAPSGKSVMLYCNQHLPIYCGKQRYGNLGEPQQGEFAWRCDSSGRFVCPTHWMPLPASPVLN